jgi:pyrimidine operon attenuation protein / uracil phosphoribosyltransferase
VARTLALVRNHYDAAEVRQFIGGLAQKLAASFDPAKPVVLVGIRTRGEVLAERLAAELAGRRFEKIGRGVLDITLYRDDLSELGPRPLVRPTKIDTDINGKPLILIDDVLFTGRTVRAGLNALADFGRPSAVRLAVLVDRGGRELPIQADMVALRAEIAPNQIVKVRLSERDGRDAIDIEDRPK